MAQTGGFQAHHIFCSLARKQSNNKTERRKLDKDCRLAWDKLA